MTSTDRSRGQISLLALALCLTSAELLLAQPSQTFIDTIDVQVVEVDVVVTDRKDRPITGLKREDFELYVDGRPAEIANFYESEVLAEPPRATGRNETPTAGTAAATGYTNDPAPLTIVLYMDDANLFPPYRTRLLKRLEKTAESWRSLNARFMFARFVNRLEVVVPPTPDLDAILDAATQRMKGQARAIQNQRSRQVVIQEMRRGGCQNIGYLLGLAAMHANEQATRAAIAADGLADLTSTLAGVPGKKAIVYVSDGLPQQPGLSVFAYIAEELCPNAPGITSEVHSAAQQYDETNRFQRISAHANANRVTLYMLDAAGIRAGLNQSMAFDGRPPSFSNDRLHWTNVQGGLHQLASETGGKALLNTNDMADLFEDVVEQLASSYSLGFVPDERRPGEVRRLKVELAQDASSGRRVEYRRSYRDKAPDERLAEQMMSVAYLGNSSNPLGVSVALGTTTAQEKKVHRLPVRIVVPEEAILLRPGPGEPSGELRLLLLAMEEMRGGRTPVRQMTVNVGGSSDVAASGGAYSFDVAVSLPENDYQVVVGVRDETTGITSLLREAVSVPQ
ncbi:MAG: VWA domain-containing protein [Acidobacteria bacterium]|nr:VWA domain-containing protein [Acidobacteriota bacterium]